MTTVAHPRLGVAARHVDPPGALARLLRGSAQDAVWVRPAAIGVSALAAILYTFNLAINGFANSYYSAAALAASQSWSAWFFGSLDASNFITVDKPPLATMVMGLSVRLFGLSSWSILLPEALMGVGAVVLLYSAVRRSFGPAAGILAALVMALTPISALVFRFNNPDALLTLLLVAAAWAFLHSLDDTRLRWAVLAATLVGFAFLTKYLQAYLVLPAFFVTFAISAHGSLRSRLGRLLGSGVVVLVASGWWVVAVQLVPATMRPFIGGSANNNVLDLIFGYDGLGRIFGGAGGGGGGGANFGGVTGLLRVFNAEFGGQISWLLPFAGIAFVSGLWIRRRAPRTDGARAGYLTWGLWLAVTALVFSFMSGTIHSYYSVAMAPAISALVGAGVVDLWRLRPRASSGGLVLAAGVVVTAWWSAQLLDRTPTFLPGLGIGILAAAAGAAILLAIPVAYQQRWVPLAAGALALAAMLAGPAVYALDTVTSAHSGSIVNAGPSTGADEGGPGGQGGFAGGTPSGGQAFAGGAGAFAGGQPPSGGSGTSGGTTGSAAPAGFGGGDATADSALVQYLVANRGSATWLVAVSGANSAASIELATGQPVIAMGGFTGSDPAPTLDQLKALASSGKLRFIVLDNNGGGGPSRSTASAISAWVEANGTVVDYGGTSNGTLYDLSGS